MKKIFLFFCIIGAPIVIKGSDSSSASSEADMQNGEKLDLNTLPPDFTWTMLFYIWTSGEYSPQEMLNVTLVCKKWLEYMREFAYQYPHKMSWIFLKHNKIKLNHGIDVEFLVFDNEDGTIITSSKNSTKIWNNKGRCITQYSSPDDIEVIQGIMIDDTKMLAIGFSAGSVVMRHILTGEIKKEFPFPPDMHDHSKLVSMLVSSDGKWLFCGCNDGVLYVWDVSQEKLIQTIKIGVCIYQISMSERMDLVLKEGEKAISLWSFNEEEKKFIRNYRTEMQSDRISSFAMYEDTPIVATKDGNTYQIDSDGSLNIVVRDSVKGEIHLEFLPQTNILLSVLKNSIKVFPLATQIEQIYNFSEDIEAYHISYDEKFLAFSQAGKMILIDISNGKILQSLSSDLTEAYPIIISIDNRKIINGSAEGKIIVRSLEKPYKEIADQNMHYLD